MCQGIVRDENEEQLQKIKIKLLKNRTEKTKEVVADTKWST